MFVNKELKALEALEKLRQNSIDGSHLFDDELLDIVETSLKKSEEILRILKEYLYIEEGFGRQKGIRIIQCSLGNQSNEEDFEIIENWLKGEKLK